MIIKWTEELNRHFSKGNIKMLSKHVEICLTSIAILGMQINTMMSYHFSPTKQPITKTTNINKYWRGYEENRTSTQY